MPNITCRVAYDPVVIVDQCGSIINTETTITVLFPNSDTLAFYGYLRSFIPDELTEGTQPEAVITIVATNRDPTDGTEQGPNYVTATGTD